MAPYSPFHGFDNSLQKFYLYPREPPPGEGVKGGYFVNQIIAVQRALQKVNGMVLDRHLHTCVTTALRGDNPHERERVIDEILDVFEATEQ